MKDNITINIPGIRINKYLNKLIDLNKKVNYIYMVNVDYIICWFKCFGLF